MRRILIFLAGVALASSAASAIPPPVYEAPDPDRFAVAVDLLRVRPLDDRQRTVLRNAAAAAIARSELAEAGMKSDARWTRRYEALGTRLRGRAAAVAADVDARAAICHSESIARRLTLADLLALKAFIATESGGRYWAIQAEGGLMLDCYTTSLRGYLEAHAPEDVAAAGAIR
jgi:hypothetical protein